MPQINPTTPAHIRNFTLGYFKKKLKSDKDKTTFLSGILYLTSTSSKNNIYNTTDNAYHSTIFKNARKLPPN